jgi:hypothetical protein
MFTATLTIMDLDMKTPRNAAEALLAAAGCARPLTVETEHQHTGQKQSITIEDWPDEVTLTVSLQERDMILAALRLWNDSVNDGSEYITPELIEIATNDQAHALMDDNEIDALCQKINH